MCGYYTRIGMTFALHGNSFFLLETFQHTLSGSLIKVTEKRTGLLHNPLLQLLTALLLVLMLHFLPFLHDVFNIHLPGDLSFDLLLFRHNQTDLTVIFLG